MPSRRYAVLGLSMILVMTVFVFFSDEDNIEYDYSGIVSDIRRGENGFTFTLNTDGCEIRCFSRNEPSYLGYYAVSGVFSDDGSIFFVSDMKDLDSNSDTNSMRTTEQHL